MLYPIVNSSRSIISLDGTWEFMFCDEDEWRTIYVPASFNNQFPEAKARFYSGVVAYRRMFCMPKIYSECRRVLRFDAVTHNAEVYIDGHMVKSHKGGFLPFEVDISDLECGEYHELIVYVDNRINHHTLPVGNEAGTAFFGSDNPGIPSVEHGKTKLSGQNLPNFDFFNYAGINRSVRIYTTYYEYIDDVTLVPSVEGNTGVVRYKVNAVGACEPSVMIRDADGNTVASAIGGSGEIRIENAKLWNPKPGIPYLYTACVSFGQDMYDIPFGIRTVEVDGCRFFINGKEFYFKGAGKHEDSFIRGRGVDQCLNLKDIELLHWLGANSFRTSHYPYSEEMYQLCDRVGIVIIDETPAVGLNFQGKINPYRLGNESFHQDLLEALVLRDKNHPSVVMWSLGNEPDTEHFPEDSYNYWHSLYEYAHKIDPQNRPVTMVCCQNDYTKDLTTKSMDIVCINRYYGWYNLSGDLSVAKDALREEMEFWKNVGKPLILTEYGADAISGMHAIVPEMFSEEFQAEYIETMNEVLDEYEFVVGEHPWNFADFDTQQGPMRAGGNHKGLFTRDRTPKMAAHALRRRWLNINK